MSFTGMYTVRFAASSRFSATSEALTICTPSALSRGWNLESEGSLRMMVDMDAPALRRLAEAGNTAPCELFDGEDVYEKTASQIAADALEGKLK